LTLGCNCAVAERKGPREWRWNSSVKTYGWLIWRKEKEVKCT
jgi:hypothetical protein